MENRFLSLMQWAWTCSMWGFHRSFWSNQIPRNLNLDLDGIGWPLMNRRGSGPGLYDLVKTTHADLSGASFNLHLELHRWTLSRAGWIMTSASDGCLQEAVMVTSSAKRYILVSGDSLGRSVSIILNRVGLRTAPCGTPFSMWMNWEDWLPTLTHRDLPVRNSWSQARIGPDIPSLEVLYSSPWVQTESYALEISRNTATVALFLLKSCLMWDSSWVMWSVVLQPLLNPACSLFIRHLCSRNH